MHAQTYTHSYTCAHQINSDVQNKHTDMHEGTQNNAYVRSAADVDDDDAEGTAAVEEEEEEEEAETAAARDASMFAMASRKHRFSSIAAAARASME